MFRLDRLGPVALSSPGLASKRPLLIRDGFVTAFRLGRISGILPLSKTSATDGPGRRHGSNLVRSGRKQP